MKIVDRYQTLLDTRDNFHKDRPVMEQNNSDLMTLLGMLGQELSETCEAASTFITTPSETSKKELSTELADMGHFLLAIFLLIGSDMFEEMMEKTAFNMLRYSAAQFQTGNYQDIRPGIKRAEKQWHMKETFYELAEGVEYSVSPMMS